MLCKGANRSVVELAVRDYTKNGTPPEYQKVLPDLDEMKRLLDLAEDTEGKTE